MGNDSSPPSRPASPSRRAFMKASGVGLAAVAGPLVGVAGAAGPLAPPRRYRFFTAQEAGFVEAATARLIPGDAESPGAREADVAVYIDRALAGPWGAGAGLYRNGPWQPGVPGQGYQLTFTPAELYRTALAAIGRERSGAGPPFADLGPEAQDAFLQTLEKGGLDLDGIPSNVFFDQLLQNTIEGFFSDPIYGGNRDMVGWKHVGFPGAYASWSELVDKHGIDLTSRQRRPLSIAHSHDHAGPATPSPRPTRNRP